MAAWQHPAKLIILGDCGTGKSHLLAALLRAVGSPVRVPPPALTIGVDLRCFTINGSCVNIWDTSGANRFYSTVQCYMADVDLALITYSCQKTMLNYDISEIECAYEGNNHCC